MTEQAGPKQLVRDAVHAVQVGGDHQERFLDEAAGPLLETLRSAAP